MSKKTEEIAELEQEKLPRSFWWWVGALGALFVLFVLTEPFYRQ